MAVGIRPWAVCTFGLLKRVCGHPIRLPTRPLSTLLERTAAAPRRSHLCPTPLPPSLTQTQTALHISTSRTGMTSSARSDPGMSQRMVWVDLEMTGLDIDKDQIIEMACIITDGQLNVLAEGPNLIIKQPDELLDGMDEWCKEHHGQSGLTQAVRDSRIGLQHAEYEFLSFVRQHTPPGHCPLAGNSVHADKKFLDKFMPQFMRHLHYRIVDVSSVKELCGRWYPEEYRLAPRKKGAHRALDDIRESIKELQFYREHIFKAPTETRKRKMVENGASGVTVE